MKKKHFNKNRATGKSEGYFVAIVFIFAGCLLLGRNMGLIDPTFYAVFMSWQMLLIAVGLYTIARNKQASGLIIMAIGAYFLLPKLSFLDEKVIGIFWPLLLIIAGLYIIFKISPSKFRKRSPEESFMQYINSEDGYIRSENSFNSIKHLVGDEVFKGGSIKNYFGGVIIDLRRAKLEGEFTYLDIECKFAGIELYIPSYWNIKIETNSFLGGCEDDRLPIANIDTEHTLVLRGTLSFSGIEIKS